MEEKMKTNNYLSYSGNVQIDILDGHRTIKSYYHNRGRQPLFEFIANCLLGNFASAKNLYPSRIACYAIKEDTEEEYERVSTFVHYDSSKFLKTDETGTSINFHFRVPYTCLVNNKKIQKIVLFPNTISSETDESCAEIKLKEPISIPADGGNFTIIVN